MRAATRHRIVFAAAVVLVGIAVSIPGIAQTTDGIPWDVASPISWSLFRGPAPSDAAQRNEPAAIHMTIQWRASFVTTSTNGRTWSARVDSVTVTNTISPSRSWHVPSKVNAQVLQHEQAHFDLNEAYRRKLEAVLLCIQAQAASKQASLDAVYDATCGAADEILNTLVEMQTRYDNETHHSIDRQAQVEWEARIAQWLLQPRTVP